MPGVLRTAIPCLSILCGHSLKVPQNGSLQKIGQVFIRFKSDPTNYDYQYLQKSDMPTDHFQDSLPRLPIPELEETCARYLRAQKPLLDKKRYEQTEAYIKAFLNGEGKILQQLLVDEDNTNKHTSYITKHWFDIYLSDRKPLPINYNPFLVFVKDPRSNIQSIRATNLVISSLRFFKSLNEGLLEPEVYHMNAAKSDTKLFRKVTGALPKSLRWYGAFLFKAFPLDMSQYKNLFNSTRIPETGKDRIKHTPGAKHMLVMWKGNFYVFDVFDKDGNIVEPDAILSNIDRILKSKDSQAEFPVGVLTTENRDVWASARKHLESLGNSEVLEMIDSSLFNLSLDEVVLTDRIQTVKSYLHADGDNRWFDKSFTLIVNKDGTAGLNFEHSWGDGVAVLRYFNEIHNDSTKHPRVSRDTVIKSEGNVSRLEFKLDDKAKTLITDAKSKYLKTVNSLHVRILDYQTFGRSLCKPLKISPDALMQLSFQMAYYRTEGIQVPTYESCSTAAFKHGRTETVRPCTIETQKFCAAVRNPVVASRTELQNMIVECSKQHSKLIKEAAMGLGFDRHLLALKLQAESHGLKSAVFEDPAYSAINRNILSTSTLSSDNIELGAFGPVVPNGFGIGYSIWNDRLGCIVTNYEGKSGGIELLQALIDSLDKLHDILNCD